MNTRAELPYLRMLSWNLAAGGPGPHASWDDVGAERGLDLALLQEAPRFSSQADIHVVPAATSFWGIEGCNPKARTCIARLSDRIGLAEIPTRPLGTEDWDEIAASRLGTLAVATLTVLATGEEINIASIYAQWEFPVPRRQDGYADGSMHRLLSDIAPLLCYRRRPFLLAGDFNSVLGWDDAAPGADWKALNDGVFQRLEDLGLQLAGPQAPHGRPATPPPKELPSGSRNVPTHKTSSGRMFRQLDYVYVSKDLVPRTTVSALNTDDDWGPSDHCRVVIEIAAP